MARFHDFISLPCNVPDYLVSTIKYIIKDIVYGVENGVSLYRVEIRLDGLQSHKKSKSSEN